MRWRRCIGVVVALAGVLLVCGVASAAGAPSWRLTDPRNGSAVTVSPGGGVLHVVFFATWCPQCVDELDSLANLEARWEEAGYRLVIVAVETRHTAPRLKAFIDARHPPGRLLFDADGSVQKALDAGSLPTHIVFDADGREVLRAPALSEGVEDALRKLLVRRKGAGH